MLFGTQLASSRMGGSNSKGLLEKILITKLNYYYYHLESAVQGRERVRALYQSKDPNPHIVSGRIRMHRIYSKITIKVV